jgi:glycosyltransferase involved in cell wall biosynthesis
MLEKNDMRLLWLNLKTDSDDPILGFTSRWIQAVAKRVEFIHVITMWAGTIEVPDNVLVYSVGKEKGYSEPRRALEFYRILFRILRRDRIDACFSHMIPIFTVIAAPLLKLKGIPVLTWYAHPSLTWTLKLAHHLSDRMVTSVATAYPYKHDKLDVIGQGIDTDLFNSDKTLPDNPPLILCVGRLSPVKDHPTLVKAVALIKNRLEKPFRVVILGAPGRPEDKAYIAHLREMVRELGIDDLIYFHPPVPMRELPAWYRKCTIHVNLTPTGFGDKVTWEAIACGRPCVAANEGFRDTFAKYTEKLLFEYANANSLAERLRWVLSLDEAERNAMGAYLRQKVVGLHSLGRLATYLTTLLKELCLRKGQ